MNDLAKRWVVACVVGFVLVNTLWAQVRSRGDVSDEWLSQAVLEELALAEVNGSFGELENNMREAVLDRLTYDSIGNLKTLSDMVFVMRSARYLPTVRTIPDSQELVKALMTHESLGRLMFRAMPNDSDAQRAFSNLAELFNAHQKLVLEYPDLAVAFATAHPLRHYQDQPAPASLVDSFLWYANSKNLRYDVKKMPFELSHYLANTRLSIPERQWAARHYSKAKNPPACYFDVSYDHEHYTQGTPKKILSSQYTLPELHRLGGVCIDQAYYAAEVCKAMGIPATIVTGTGSSGMGHAWVASFQMDPSGKRAAWDSSTGRYAPHQYYVGEVINPLTGQAMEDCELMLVGSAALLPRQRREQAHASCELADLVARECYAGTAEREGAMLRKLAQSYIERHGEVKAPIIPELSKKLDMTLVEELLAAALDKNLAHRPAWDLIVFLRKSGRMEVENLDRFFDVLLNKTAKDYPDYSCSIIMKICSTIENAPKRQQVYERALRIYPRRPDLQGNLLIALGDDLQDSGELRKALMAYDKATQVAINCGPVLLRAASRVEAMMMNENRPDMAIRMYAKLFQKTSRNRNTSAFRKQTANYQLGERLSQLLADAGRQADSMEVRRRMEE